MIEKDKTQLSGADAGRPARPQLEICICAAIVAENGEIIRGHRHMDCLRTAGERSLRQKPGHEYQGFVTSRNRYVDRKEAAALQLAAGVASADPEHPYLNGECYSEDLYAALAVPSSSVDQAVRQISEAIRTPVHSEAQQDGDHFTHRLAVQASAPATHDPRLIDAVAPALRACAEARPPTEKGPVIKTELSDVHTGGGSRCATDPTTVHAVNAATVQPSGSVIGHNILGLENLLGGEAGFLTSLWLGGCMGLLALAISWSFFQLAGRVGHQQIATAQRGSVGVVVAAFIGVNKSDVLRFPHALSLVVAPCPTVLTNNVRRQSVRIVNEAVDPNISVVPRSQRQEVEVLTVHDSNGVVDAAYLIGHQDGWRNEITVIVDNGQIRQIRDAFIARSMCSLNPLRSPDRDISGDDVGRSTPRILKARNDNAIMVAAFENLQRFKAHPCSLCGFGQFQSAASGDGRLPSRLGLMFDFYQSANGDFSSNQRDEHQSPIGESHWPERLVPLRFIFGVCALYSGARIEYRKRYWMNKSSLRGLGLMLLGLIALVGPQ